MVGPEKCDDGNNGGCLSDCSGPVVGYMCIGGSNITSTICNPKCGDGLVIGNEKCDDLVLIGCLKNCSGPNPGYICA